MTTNKISKKYVRKKIGPLISIGNILSNIAYNSRQRDDVPKDIRESCLEFQERWDAIRQNLPKWITKY